MSTGQWATLAAAAGGLSLLVLGVWLVTWRPRPRPGPPALDPGPESPAVASLLVSGGGWRRWAAATVLDLGARGCLDLEWTGQTVLVCRGVGTPPASPLPFERRILDRATALTRAADVPAGALLPDPRDQEAGAWQHAFEREVGEAAVRLGLARPRLPGAIRWLLTAAVLPLPALVLAASFPDRWASAAIFGALGGPALAGLVYALLPGGWVPTAAGRAAARRWLGLRAALLAAGPRRPAATPAPLADALLAGAVAVGADPALAAAFAAPARGYAWSGYGGRWRPVRIVGPARRRGWIALGGLLLLFAVGAGAFIFVLSAWLSPGGGPQLILLAPLPLAALLLVLGGIALAVRYAGRESGGRRTFDGQVVQRLMHVSTGEDDRTTYELVIDDGTDRAWTWSIDESQYERCPAGTVVRATTDGFGTLVAVTPLTRDAGRPEGEEP